VELLRAFRQAYQSLGLAGEIIGTDVDPLAPALQLADHAYMVPRLSEPGFILALVEICRSRGIHLVFPLIDPEIPLLAEKRLEIEAAGARVAVVSLQAAALAADKWETFKFFRGHNLPTPQSWLPCDLALAEGEFPVFIKPRFGSASKDTFVVRNARELAFFLDFVPQPLVQEFVQGPEITTDVISDLEGELLGIVSRQRIEVRWGEVAKGVTVFHPQILEGCIQIARELPARGPITIQCIFKDGVPYFTEINARFAGGAPLGIKAGVDSPRMLLARAAGLPAQMPPLGEYQTGLYMTRFDDAFFLSEGERAAMLGRHL
jgi:carbamoyl-phosphate synthase large subunit